MGHLNEFPHLLFNSSVSLRSKLVFALVVACYELLPIDLIPDVFLPLGFVDDGGLALAAIAWFTRQARAQLEAQSISPVADDASFVIQDQSNAVSAPTPAEGLPRAIDNRQIHIHQSRPRERSDLGCLCADCGAAVVAIRGSCDPCLVGQLCHQRPHRAETYQFGSGACILLVPAPQLTSCRIEYITQHDGSFTLCGTNWDTLRQLAQHDAMANFVENAIENGILERAKAEAAYVLEDFVRAVTGRPVRVVFEDTSSELELARSCQPAVPSGWAKDESGTWKQE